MDDPLVRGFTLEYSFSFLKKMKMFYRRSKFNYAQSVTHLLKVVAYKKHFSKIKHT